MYTVLGICILIILLGCFSTRIFLGVLNVAVEEERFCLVELGLVTFSSTKTKIKKESFLTWDFMAVR